MRWHTTAALLLSTLSGLVQHGYAQQRIGPCTVLPANNIWNTPVDGLAKTANSTTLVTTIGATGALKADFGSGLWNGGPIGIPFVTVPGTQAKFPATFLYADESDPGPYAVPLNAPIEGGAASDGDRHAIALDRDNCVLYELYRAFPQSSSWKADSGAIFDLKSNALRPATWTSADAAGLPIVPGLVNYDEVLTGEVRHAIRFTAPRTRRAFVWPARHYASSLTGAEYPRMGERLRLRADFDVSGFPPEVQVILRALKKYGMILADNGSAWYLSGAPDARWNNDNLRTLARVKGADFEVVDATALMVSPDSGEARQAGPPPVTVTVSPATATVRVGRSRQFAAAVAGTTDTRVNWSATAGAVDGAGRYTAPGSVPAGTVTVTAASVPAAPAAGSAAVTVLPLPRITSLAPSPVPAGAFTLTVNGEGFVGGSTVWFRGAPLATTFVSAAQLRAAGNAAAGTGIAVYVATPDNETSNTVTVEVTAPPAPAPVTIAISPATATVRVLRSLQFKATVTGTANQQVLWLVNGIRGGNYGVGTINGAGVYVAPARVPKEKVTVTVQLAADPARAASANVQVVRNQF